MVSIDKTLDRGDRITNPGVGVAVVHQGSARARHLLGLFVLALLATIAITAQLWQVQGDNVYQADLRADYLRGRALRDGQDIFVSIDALANRYFPVPGSGFSDPSPHPPVVALIFVPATLIPFPLFGALWVILDVSLLLLVGRWLRLSPLQALALGAWPPLFLTLKVLQWEVVLLALVMACWRDAERGRDLRAGVWLGLAGVVKLYPILLVLPFLYRRQYRTVGAAVGVLALGQVGSLVAVGPSGLWRYYTSVLPHLGTVAYAGALVDTSVHGTLLRIFGVGPLVLILTGAASLVALVALARLPREAGPVAVMLLLPTYVLSMYLTLGLPLIVGLWRDRRLRGLVILSSILASFPYFTIERMVHLPLPSPLLGSVEPLGYLGLLASAALLAQRDRALGRNVSSGEA